MDIHRHRYTYTYTYIYGIPTPRQMRKTKKENPPNRVMTSCAEASDLSVAVYEGRACKKKMKIG